MSEKNMKELDSEEMEKVSGGSLHFYHQGESYTDWTCPTCNETYIHYPQYVINHIAANHEQAHANGTAPKAKNEWVY